MSVVTRSMAMFAMALDALMHAAIAFLHVALLGGGVGAPVRQVEIVANALFLLVESTETETMQAGRELGSILTLLLATSLGTRIFVRFGIAGRVVNLALGSLSGRPMLLLLACCHGSGEGKTRKRTAGLMYKSFKALSTGNDLSASGRNLDRTLSATLDHNSLSARRIDSIVGPRNPGGTGLVRWAMNSLVTFSCPAISSARPLRVKA